MSNNVVALDGGPISSPLCQQDLVEFLEDALEKAKSGEIIGMSGVMVHPSTVGAVRCSTWFVRGDWDSHSAVGGLEVAKARIVKEMLG